MSTQYQRMSFQFGSQITSIGKKMLIMYAVIYVLQLICEHWIGIPIFQWLALSPVQSAYFEPWQLITHPFVHDPRAPISFLLNCLIFYFFAGTIESALGTRRFFKLYVIAAIGGALGGLLFSGIASFSVPYAGMMPSLLALIVVFGLMQPEATILLMFIIPIKAKYIAYGTIILTAITFLAMANPHGAYHLGGILFAYLYFRPPTQLFNANWWRWKYFEINQKRRRSKFTVINRKDDNDQDKPTIH